VLTTKKTPRPTKTYAKVSDEERALDKLEVFSSLNDPAHYGLPPNQGTITLKRISSVAPEDITVPGLDELALIYRGGKTIG
jgi:dihydroorotase